MGKNPSAAPDPQPSIQTGELSSPDGRSPDGQPSPAYLAEVLHAVVTSDELLARAQTARAQSAYLSKRLQRHSEQLQRVLEENAMHREALRAAVARVVRTERDRNEPPERALVAVKEHVLRLLPSAMPHKERVALEETVVRWAIDAYYAAAS